MSKDKEVKHHRLVIDDFAGELGHKELKEFLDAQSIYLNAHKANTKSNNTLNPKKLIDGDKELKHEAVKEIKPAKQLSKKESKQHATVHSVVYQHTPSENGTFHPIPKSSISIFSVFFEHRQIKTHKLNR